MRVRFGLSGQDIEPAQLWQLIQWETPKIKISEGLGGVPAEKFDLIKKGDCSVEAVIFRLLYLTEVPLAVKKKEPARAGSV